MAYAPRRLGSETANGIGDIGFFEFGTDLSPRLSPEA
jgi:hypothetical protein